MGSPRGALEPRAQNGPGSHFLPPPQANGPPTRSTAAGVQPTNGSMVYLGGEQLATGAAASVAASSASRIIMAVALAAIVLPPAEHFRVKTMARVVAVVQQRERSSERTHSLTVGVLSGVTGAEIRFDKRKWGLTRTVACESMTSPFERLLPRCPWMLAFVPLDSTLLCDKAHHQRLHHQFTAAPTSRRHARSPGTSSPFAARSRSSDRASGGSDAAGAPRREGLRSPPFAGDPMLLAAAGPGLYDGHPAAGKPVCFDLIASSRAPSALQAQCEDKRPPTKFSGDAIHAKTCLHLQAAGLRRAISDRLDAIRCQTKTRPERGQGDDGQRSITTGYGLRQSGLAGSLRLLFPAVRTVRLHAMMGVEGAMTNAGDHRVAPSTRRPMANFDAGPKLARVASSARTHAAAFGFGHGNMRLPMRAPDDCDRYVLGSPKESAPPSRARAIRAIHCLFAFRPARAWPKRWRRFAAVVCRLGGPKPNPIIPSCRAQDTNTKDHQDAAKDGMLP
ncbi:hypothetical protein HU200_025249 [Digitaria exilis]|uniref:Uncharacterized protein n=1 Tax=Digitaria exilis TaxID=1010633 RepID=A0A835EST0_9POAL|nr:hypothetical protein HU200_025249 [Digitaria exilis]